MWLETQDQFAAALSNPDLPPPSSIGMKATKRFNVYRNNVSVSLSEALGATFPIVQALVGDEFFQGMTQIFTRQSLPKTPVLLDYGSEFPDFITTFSPAQTIPYLADIARLEWAWNRAYHSADVRPVTIKHLAKIPQDQVAHVCLHFHPSLHLLQSSWPIASIWQAHQPRGFEGGLPGEGENVLILRPELDVEIRNLNPQALQFLSALFEGATLGQASELFVEDQSFDLSSHLAALFTMGAVIGLTSDFTS